jgi:hypothetical protein
MIGVHELVMDSVLLMFVIPAAMVFFDGFSRHGTTLAESAAYSTLSVIMVLSWLAQIIVLAGWVNAYLPAILSLRFSPLHGCMPAVGGICPTCDPYTDFRASTAWWLSVC